MKNGPKMQASAMKASRTMLVTAALLRTRRAAGLGPERAADDGT